MHGSLVLVLTFSTNVSGQCGALVDFFLVNTVLKLLIFSLSPTLWLRMARTC